MYQYDNSDGKIAIEIDLKQGNVTFSNGGDVLPKADSEGNIGIADKRWLAGYINNLYGNLTGNVTGNAATATKWATSRTISLTGSVTGSASIDGGENVSLSTTTTAANLGFTQSLAASGWTKLPNGLVIQWGYNTNGTIQDSGAAPITNSFPIAFSTVFMFNATPRNAAVAQSFCITTTFTNTQYGVAFKGITTKPYSWIAMGK